MDDRRSKLDAILEDINATTRLLSEKNKDGSWKNHHKNADGEQVHSSGKKENKKFANNTTFKSAPQDALLHTDGNKDGIRARLGKDQFAVPGSKEQLKKDPRKKWYPVSYQRGWASAAGSLRQAYEKGKELRQKVMQKVQQTRFVGAEGAPIEPGTIDPMGKLKGERPECKIKRVPHPSGDGTRRMIQLRPSHPMHDHVKRLQAAGKHGEAQKHIQKAARMCKDHGVGGPPEQGTKFRPQSVKHQSLHKPGGVSVHSPGPSASELTSRAAGIKQKVRHMMRQSKASGEHLTR